MLNIRGWHPLSTHDLCPPNTGPFSDLSPSSIHYPHPISTIPILYPHANFVIMRSRLSNLSTSIKFNLINSNSKQIFYFIRLPLIPPVLAPRASYPHPLHPSPLPFPSLKLNFPLINTQPRPSPQTELVQRTWPFFFFSPSLFPVSIPTPASSALISNAISPSPSSELESSKLCSTSCSSEAFRLRCCRHIYTLNHTRLKIVTTRTTARTAIATRYGTGGWVPRGQDEGRGKSGICILGLRRSSSLGGGGGCQGRVRVRWEENLGGIREEGGGELEWIGIGYIL